MRTDEHDEANGGSSAAIILASGMMLPPAAAMQRPVTRARRTRRRRRTSIGAVLSLTGRPRRARHAREEGHRAGGGAHQRRGRRQRPSDRGLIEDDATDVDQGRRCDHEAHRAGRGASRSSARRAPVSRWRCATTSTAQVPQVSMAGGSHHHRASSTRSCSRRRGRTDLVVPFTLQHLKDEGYTKIGLITEDTALRQGRPRARERDGLPSTVSTIVADEIFKPRRHRHDHAAHEDRGRRRRRPSGCGHRWQEAAIVREEHGPARTWSLPLVCAHGIAKQEFIDRRGRSGRGRDRVRREDAGARDVRRGHRGVRGRDRVRRRATRRSTARRRTIFAGHAYDGLYIVVEALKRLDEGFTLGRPARRDRADVTSFPVSAGRSRSRPPTTTA